MKQRYRSTVRSQFLALQRVRRFAPRGVTIEPKQVDAVITRIREKLHLARRTLFP